MAKQGCCTVYCGDDKLNYDWMNLHLWDMTTYLHARGDYGLNDLLQEPRNNLRRSLRHMVVSKAASDGAFPPRGIPHLMRFLLSYHSTHPVDKIFAFYGILKEIGVPMPTPDYGVSLGVVYWTATLALLAHEPSTALLSLASGVDGRLGDVPSWVSAARENEIFDTGQILLSDKLSLLFDTRTISTDVSFRYQTSGCPTTSCS